MNPQKPSNRLRQAEREFLESITRPTRGKPIHQSVVEAFRGDAERAFAQALPVGSTTPDGVNPGRIYQVFREVENSEHRKKEAGLYYGRAAKVADDLARWSLELLRNLQNGIPRMGDTESRFRRQRENAVQMAMDYPRALSAMKSTLCVLHRQYAIDGLRSAMFSLGKSEKDWTAFSRRMRDTQKHPVGSWCARVKELQYMAETIRRGLSA